MGKRIVILGAGFGGLTAANILRKNLGREHRVILLDRKNWFMMGLVKLWVLEGTRSLEESKIPLAGLNAKGIEYINDEITKIDTAESRVQTKVHGWIEYDYLIVALGAELAPEKVPGFVERGYNLYDPQQVPKLREQLMSTNRGKVAVAIMGMPYKCPPAPYEASIIISNLLARGGKKESIEIDLYAPAPIALPVAGPQISATVVHIISQHGIQFHPSHKIVSVSEKQLEFENGVKKDYDLLVGIPPHRVPEVIRNSGLTSGGDWISVDRQTMRTSITNVFAVGDVIEIKIGPTVALPKAGIFAEEQAKVVAQQIIDEISGKPAAAVFSGQGYCFMEVGNHQAGYLEADFYNAAGPILRLEPASERNYEKKQEFERTRIKEWLL
jgi:sulfide:quinone oxidoreductase